MVVNVEKYAYPLWLENEAKQPYELQPTKEVEKAKAELADTALAVESLARLAQVRADLAKEYAKVA